MDKIDQIASEAAEQISFNWARCTKDDVQDIIKAAIEEAVAAERDAKMEWAKSCQQLREQLAGERAEKL